MDLLSYKCHIEGCGKHFPRRDGLDRHIRFVHSLTKSFVCDHNDCGKRFATNTQLYAHQKYKHLNMRSKPFRCSLKGCSALFTRKESLESHERRHVEGVVYACEWPGCHYTAYTAGHLNQHRRDEHTDQGILRVCDWPDCQFQLQPKFVCHWPACDKRFIFKNTLNKHVLIHSGDKQFKCEVEGCGYRSSERGNVKQHMLKHNRITGNVDWFPCQWPQCGKQFVRKSDLKKHLLIHSRKD
ncbi:unnamed protein product [Oppiella nova]|uniref:C2H2-type domain-containing protein n=1 Tax=Oppiella nova TaxID=334625 RepID=A0A7R9M6B8_9ACAR|nr:unnamed protein product [Oppiella nova]CAG2171487.1 unnamed protein product [Oppiella nova]